MEIKKRTINIKNPTTGEWEQIPALQGEKGDTGSQGPKGDKGDKGDAGATGPQGPKGDTGDNKVGYGNCSTEADVAEKIVTVDDPNWKLEVGSLIMVRFSVANSAGNVTLNVNNTGAYGIRTTGDSAYTGTSTTYTGAVNRGLTYIFDGSHWQWISSGAYPSSTTNVSLGQGYATCSTAASTKAKTASLSSYTLSTGGIVAVRFSYDVPAGATLNINSKGAKAIYHKNAAITDGVIKAGDTATFIYSTYYRLISIDRDYATKEYVDEAIESIDVTNQLTNYALKTELPTKTSQLTNDSGYITSIPSDYVTDEELNAKNYAVTGHTHSQYASTSYVQSQIANLTSGSNIPSYVLTEAEMIANKVIEKRNAYSLVISAMSDLHTTGTDTSATGVLHAFQGINEIDKITEVDLVTIHGDVCVVYMDETYQEAFKYVKTCMNEVTKNIPLIHMQGNHDDLPEDSTEVARQKYYRYIGSNNKGVVTDFENRFRNYGYMDFDELRIRYIYLSSVDASEYERTSNEWITPMQFKWFINTALDFSNKEGADDWQWIVGTHHPLNTEMGASSNTAMKLLRGVLQAYTKKQSGSFQLYHTDVTSELHTISYDFTNVKQKMICHVHGHIHNYRVEWFDDVLSITVPNACFGRNNEYGTHTSYNDTVRQYFGDIDENGNQRQYNKVSGTANDTAFVTLVIDPRVDKKIYVYSYGAGIDREIDLTTKEIKYIDKVVDDTPVEPDTPTIPSDDVIRKSIDTDGSIYNGVGYKENSYIVSDSSSGTIGSILTRNGVTVTGFIPMTQGSSMTATGERIIELYNINVVPTEGNLRVACYDKDFTCLGLKAGNTFATDTVSSPKVITTTNSSGYIATLDISAFSYACKQNRGKDVAYIRICSPSMTDSAYILLKSNSASDTPSATYTNLIPKSVDIDGSLYNNGKGYKTGYRINSSGQEAQQDGMCCTGFIPITSPTVGTATVRLKNVTVSGTKTSYFVTYQQDKTYIQVTELGVSPLKDDGTGTLVGETNHTGWIRICCGVIDDTSILTIDEEIVGDTPSGGFDYGYTAETVTNEDGTTWFIESSLSGSTASGYKDQTGTTLHASQNIYVNSGDLIRVYNASWSGGGCVQAFKSDGTRVAHYSDIKKDTTGGTNDDIRWQTRDTTMRVEIKSSEVAYLRFSTNIDDISQVLVTKNEDVGNLIVMANRTYETYSNMTDNTIPATTPQEQSLDKYYATIVDGRGGKYCATKIINHTVDTVNNGFTYKITSSTGYGLSFPVDVKKGRTYFVTANFGNVKVIIDLVLYDKNNVYVDRERLTAGVGGDGQVYNVEFNPTGDYNYALWFSCGSSDINKDLSITGLDVWQI